MDSLHTRSNPSFGGMMDKTTTHPNHMSQILSAFQFLQCLQTARKELESIHLPTQMAQIATYLHSQSEPNRSNQFPAIFDAPTGSGSSVQPSTSSSVSHVFQESSREYPSNCSSKSVDIDCSFNTQYQPFDGDLSFLDDDFDIPMNDDHEEWIESIFALDDSNASLALHESGKFSTSEGHPAHMGNRMFEISKENTRSTRLATSTLHAEGGFQEIITERKRKRKSSDEDANVVCERREPNFGETKSRRLDCGDFEELWKSMRPRQPRGTATDPQSVSARKRREKIRQKINTLQEIVPNGKTMDIASMLKHAISYVRCLEAKVHELQQQKMKKGNF